MGLSFCLVGYGYWGKNLLRNLTKDIHPQNLSVVEKSDSKRAQLQSSYPGISVYSSFSEALSSQTIDAVIIATETANHFTIAKQALEYGKHVLVEKPITTSKIQAEELNQIATDRHLILMVDHVFLYHPVVRKMKEYFNQSFLGRINYIDTTRINLGIYQDDVNVIWDLACHDISIINYLVVEKPHSVRAIGRKNPLHGSEDIAYMFLYYPSGLLVQINSSWASPVKIRKMIVGGEKRMLIYDDIEPTNKLTIYEYDRDVKGDDSKSKLTDYRLGNILIPKYETTEALQNVIREFYQCIENNIQPLSNGANGIEVVNILEKAQLSLSLNGAIVDVF